MAAFRAYVSERRSFAALSVVVCVALAGLAYAAPAHGALPDTSSPSLSLNRTIATTPFKATSTAMKDNEASAYVAGDNSLWLGDDNGRMLYEIDASTGALKRTIDRKALEKVTQYGGGPQAGTYRTRDLESLSYDVSTDTLYAFSGSCCTTSVLPTVFRLTRQNGQLRLDSYQPLPAGSDNTASAWNPGDSQVYVTKSKDMRTYDYTTNTFGSVFRIGDVSGILGMDFSPDGADLYVSRTNATLSRVNWSQKSLVTGWNFDLSSFGVLDSRAVALIGDQFYVSDGADSRDTGDPLEYVVFVFDVQASSSSSARATS